MYFEATLKKLFSENYAARLNQESVSFKKNIHKIIIYLTMKQTSQLNARLIKLSIIVKQSKKTNSQVNKEDEVCM